MWEPSALYDFYVAALRASVQLAVVLSLLVSADRVLNVLKFACIKLRAKLTGRLPQDAWFRAPLPKAPEEYPLVSGWAAGGSARLAALGSAGAASAPAWPGCQPMPQAAGRSSAGWSGAGRPALLLDCAPRKRGMPRGAPLAPPRQLAERSVARPAAARCWVQVAVQLPMFNERAVCQAIIDCCAELEWPAQRLKIQVRRRGGWGVGGGSACGRCCCCWGLCLPCFGSPASSSQPAQRRLPCCPALSLPCPRCPCHAPCSFSPSALLSLPRSLSSTQPLPCPTSSLPP